MKKYLLDTHVVIWVAENSPLLSAKAKRAVLDPGAAKYVSIASAWEVAIKLKTEKLSITGGLPEFYRMIDENGFATLSIEREHLQQIQFLPYHHRDPFDRLLITTAASEGMALITGDSNIHKYNVPWIW